MKSRVVLMTRIFNWAVLGAALGGGTEMTRIRSMGEWGSGERELEGPEELVIGR